MRTLATMDFANVVQDKKLKRDTPLRRGDLVMVMGDRSVPASSSDPYLSRKLVIVAQTKGGKPLIPSDSNEHQAYLVDPRNLEWVGEDEQTKLEAALSSRGE